MSETGGRAQLSRLHWRCCKSLFGDDAELHLLRRSPAGFRAALAGRIDGADQKGEQLLLERAERNGVRQIYLDGSNLGRLACAVKRHLPAIEVITFLHNVEARFFAGAFRHSPSARSAGVLLANYSAERAAVRYSDRLIALNDRDSALLRRVYGRAATDVVPMALEPHDQRASEEAVVTRDDYLLFVGGGFYANAAGMGWFARTVAPRLQIATCVVGRGFEPLRTNVEQGGTVRIVGAVDDLAPWYRGARAVIAPIFDGSGMKTKVAEALMYGKRVIGTREAFVGYEDIVDQVGSQCDTADQFVAAVAALDQQRPPAFDPALRLLFDQRHSYTAARERLGSILLGRSKTDDER